MGHGGDGEHAPAHRAERYKREDDAYKLKVKAATRKGEPPPPAARAPCCGAGDRAAGGLAL